MKGRRTPRSQRHPIYLFLNNQRVLNIHFINITRGKDPTFKELSILKIAENREGCKLPSSNFEAQLSNVYYFMSEQHAIPLIVLSRSAGKRRPL